MRDDDETGDDIASEQRADLAALEAAAGQAGQGGPQPVQVQEQAQEPIQPPSTAAMAAATMLVGIVRPLVDYAVPALRGAPDELWMPVPEGVAAVVDHYGGGAEWMRHPLARLGMALAPLAAYGAAMSIKDKGKRPPEALAPPEPGAPALPGAKTVTMGTVMPAEGGAA